MLVYYTKLTANSIDVSQVEKHIHTHSASQCCGITSTVAHIFSPPGTSAQMNEKHRNESYSLKQINSQVYNVATSTPNYSSESLGFTVAPKREEIDFYDVIDHNLNEASKPQAPVSPTPVEDNVSKKGDDFYDAEEHIYPVVNVKNKKKTKTGCHRDTR